MHTLFSVQISYHMYMYFLSCVFTSVPIPTGQEDSSNPLQMPFCPNRFVGLNTGFLTWGATSSMSRELDFFLMFFSTAVLENICNFTNIYAWSYILDKPSYGDSFGNAKTTGALQLSIMVTGLKLYEPRLIQGPTGNASHCPS